MATTDRAAPPVRPNWWSRRSHDTRVTLLVVLSGLPAVAPSLGLLWLGDFSSTLRWTLATVLLVAWALTAGVIRRQVVRPLQTLSNMLAALREGDFSIRARVPGHDARDPLSLVYQEVNALEDVLREQRLGAVEAGELLRKVLEEVDVAIFAFDD